jgi:hypothetical protein
MPREFARKQLIYLTILAANGGFPRESTKFPVSTGKIVNFAPHRRNDRGAVVLPPVAGLSPLRIEIPTL